MTHVVSRTFRRISDILTKEQREILKTASLLMVPSVLSKITGIIALVLTATQLGTTGPIDDFNLANTIPETLANILLLGVVSAVVIPIFIEAKEEGGEEAFLRVYNTVVNVSLGVFLIATVFVFLFADATFPWLLQNVIRPEKLPEDVGNVVAMMKFLMIPNLILGISVFVTSGLSVYHRLLVPQLSPLLYNCGRIFAAMFLLPMMNYSPWALVIGGLIGSLLHLAIQLPLAYMLKLRYEPVLDLKNKYVQKVFVLSLPRGVAFGAEQISLAAGKFIATHFGKISVLNYANSMAVLIPSLFGYSFAIASFPTISEMYTRKQFQEISTIVIRTINQIVFLSAPFVIAIMVMRLPIVRLTFGFLPGTKFLWEDTLLVSWTLLCFSFGTIFTSVNWYLYRVFYAAKNMVIPLLIAVVDLGATVTFGWLFSNLLSHSHDLSLAHIQISLENFLINGGERAAVGGVALGLSTAAIIEFVLLLFFINVLVVKIPFKELFKRLMSKAIPIGLTSALMLFMYKTWDTLSFPIDATPGFRGSTTLNLFVLTTITLFTSFMVYYLLCYLFEVEEIKILRRFLNPLFKLGGFSIKD